MASPCASGRRSRRSGAASARCTRRSTCCPTSRSPRTSSSGRSRAGSVRSTGRRCGERAAALLAELGLDHRPRLPARHPLARHPAARRDRARDLDSDVRVLVLDEPTSSLDADEVAELFRVIRELKERGVAVLFISHFLDQVYEIGDRITVLARAVRWSGEYRPTELLRIDLVEKMLGREITAEMPRPAEPGPTTRVVVAAQDLRRGAHASRRRHRGPRGRGGRARRAARLRSHRDWRACSRASTARTAA